MQKSILVIDDDDNFRKLVASLFQLKGYHVVEAATADEGTSLFSATDTVLAVVDYQMPGTDGITWITRLREAGKNVPVIFVSRTECDARTFNWLRNILRVSLIIKKPIVPDLFMQQIEQLLPDSVKEAAAFTASGSRIEKVPATDSQTKLINALRREKPRPELEAAVAALRNEYVPELKKHWTTLTNLIKSFQADPTRLDLRSEAIQIAHRVCGTSGSVGLDRVSKYAGKLEHFTAMIDPVPSTDQEIIWSEMFRYLADGETAVQAAVKAAQSTANAAPALPNILALVNPDEVGASLKSLASELANIEITGSLPGAAQQMKTQRFDALMIDTTLALKDRLLEAVQELRGTAPTGTLPVACITSLSHRLANADLLYLGASTVIDRPLDLDQVNVAVKDLCELQGTGKAKVLVVDDDEVLCQFVSTVLESEGMAASSLTQPIGIIDALADFKPDLVLLDVMMPGLSGYEVCRIIRQSEQWCDMPVVFLTSKSSAESRAAAFQAGGNDFLSKPVVTEEVVTRVKAQLELSARRKRLSGLEENTGLYLINVFFQKAHEWVARAHASSRNATVSILVIDDVADLRLRQSVHSVQEMVRHLAWLIRTRFRCEDVRGCWGDDGFALAFPGVDRETASDSIKLLLDEFAQAKFTGTIGTFKGTFSAGVADIANDGHDLEQLLYTANNRMTKARRHRSGAVEY